MIDSPTPRVGYDALARQVEDYLASRNSDINLEELKQNLADAAVHDQRCLLLQWRLEGFRKKGGDTRRKSRERGKKAVAKRKTKPISKAMGGKEAAASTAVADSRLAAEYSSPADLPYKSKSQDRTINSKAETKRRASSMRAEAPVARKSLRETANLLDPKPVGIKRVGSWAEKERRKGSNYRARLLG